jgi:hypothetical protein
VWISDTVERVWNVLPQPHLTVAVAYSGWMSFFMEKPLGFERASVEGVVHLDGVAP